MTPSHPAVIASHRIDQLRRHDPSLRQRLLAVRTWALAHGVTVDRDGLTVVVAALDDAARHRGVEPEHWTAARVVEFIWAECPLWCRDHGVAPPRGAPDALRVWWRYLAHTEAFTPGSDALATLLATLDTHAGRPPRRPKSATRKQRSRTSGHD